ncbi:DUF262 domain-containing protein [Agromyces kandeliae]|uniref:DUF262 domain-containing protein n=1 Tax=Agromyces kandeliae TaxID=2666141 RepID=A0A6L5R5V3_9MICO|nr:DUF262 domain-containing protein [Agromyces kandeliae]MRX44507.1 DUF262 domain-containing protein [Agromyces kandeliae]
MRRASWALEVDLDAPVVAMAAELGLPRSAWLIQSPAFRRMLVLKACSEMQVGARNSVAVQHTIRIELREELPMTPAKSMLTNSSDELPLARLLGSGTIFSIPFFQRPYKWSPDKIKELNEDIKALIDVPNDIHFLGAIITHGLPRSNSADVSVSEVIDGQQRLTTVYLYVCAAVKVMLENDALEDAQSFFAKFLTIQLNTKQRSNLALHPSHEDRRQLNAIIDDLLDTRSFAKHLGAFAFKRLSVSGTGPSRSVLRNNYNAAKRFMNEQFDQGGVARVGEAINGLLERMTVVQIEIQDPTNGPKIFNSLNSRQEPMTIGDLVRNDIFARGPAEDADEMERVNAELWQPFYQRFIADRLGKDVNYFDSYFFPFGLVHDPNITKSDVYTRLSEKWKGFTPREVISELSEYQPDFMTIVTGKNVAKHGKDVFAAFGRLAASGAPSSSYPFLMSVSRAIRMEKLVDHVALDILTLVEAFLVRRALSSIEPTGLHAVFKRLWVESGNHPNAESVMTAMKKHKTVKWPTDSDVRAGVQATPMYRSAVCKYFLIEYDRGLGGDHVQSQPWVEHVLPDAWSPKQWPSVSRDDHNQLKDVLGNLLPLTSEMNAELSNSAYASKRPVYSRDSVFKSARMLGEANEDWNAETIVARGKEMADWAVTRWMDPSVQTGSE